MAEIILGRVRPVFTGDWDEERAYVLLDRFLYNNTLYECVKDAPAGTAIENTEYYVVVVEEGPQGPKGPPPSHRWTGTTLYMENADGTYDDGTDLIGPQPPLSDSVSSTDTTIAASSLAVKTVNDRVTTNETGLESVNQYLAKYSNDIEAISFIEEFRKSWIGVPRFYHGKTLPANCMWAERGSFTLGDYPEFKALWDAGAFEGMSQTYTDTLKTSALGNWLIDGSGDTAIIYMPDLRNCFFRCTGAGFQGMGGINQAGLPNITAHWIDEIYYIPNGTGNGALSISWGSRTSTYILSTSTTSNKTWVDKDFNASRSSSIYGNSNTVMPYSVNYPVMIYLGRHA